MRCSIYQCFEEIRLILARGHESRSNGSIAKILLARSLGIGEAPSVVEGPLVIAESISIGSCCYPLSR